MRATFFELTPFSNIDLKLKGMGLMLTFWLVWLVPPLAKINLFKFARVYRPWECKIRSYVLHPKKSCLDMLYQTNMNIILSIEHSIQVNQIQVKICRMMPHIPCNISLFDAEKGNRFTLPINCIYYPLICNMDIREKNLYCVHMYMYNIYIQGK